MPAICVSTGFFYTSVSAVETMKCDGGGSVMLKLMAYLSVLFSLVFMVLQFIPIPGLSGVHFGIESYILLAVCVAFWLMFYLMQRKKLTT